MRQHVKVKCVSLADEARLIGRYERQRLEGAAKARKQGNQIRADYNFQNYWTMRQHRINDIRKEARIANIAYGFMLGHPYSTIERNSYTQPHWTRIKALVMAKGEGDNLEERYDQWEKEALAGQTRLEFGGIPNEWVKKVGASIEVQPRSIKNLTLWVLRLFQGNVSAWMQWLRQTHPLHEKKPYVKNPWVGAFKDVDKAS